MAMMLFPVLAAQAQEQKNSEWYFGLTEGLHCGGLRFSDVDDNAYDSKKSLCSPVISVFVQGEFGGNRQFAVRPEVAYVRRGGTLKDFIVDDDVTADYKLKADFLDLRLSLIYNFGRSDSRFRPYVFVTPKVGFCTGGDVSLEAEDNGVYGGVRSDLSDANMAKTYFAVAPGVGFKWHFRTGSRAQNLCWLGLEANYEIGLSDTYGSKEKDREAVDLAGNARYKINGTRKMSGFEVKAVLGIPFSVFSKPKAAPAPVVVEEPVVVAEPEPEEEKPCYTLEEIIDMMALNKDVTGKTICAVDAINFDFGASTIKPESHSYLDKLAETLKRTNARIQVKGHTDNIGSDEFNMNLSRERAQAVVNYLLGKGVNRSKLSYDYYGASMPLTTNDTEEGRTMNRRVEFEIMK